MFSKNTPQRLDWMDRTTYGASPGLSVFLLQLHNNQKQSSALWGGVRRFRARMAPKRVKTVEMRCQSLGPSWLGG